MPTITFGDKAVHGFSVEDLMDIRERFDGLNTHLDVMSCGDEEAGVLVIEDVWRLIPGCKSSDDIYDEHYNLRYDEMSREPVYDQGKGRVIAWKDIPLTHQLHQQLISIFPDKGVKLRGEGNLYFDVTKCEIRFHSDSERKIVAALRLGEELPLCYQWYLQGKPIGKMETFHLPRGSIYVMSEKATGHDWKRRKIPTLRYSWM